MRIALLTAGAGGMYCGSCLRDNALAAALLDRGEEVVLLPAYTPIRTDERDVSAGPVFYGGLNVYLQQKWGLFRHSPAWLDRALDSPRLIRWAARWSARTDARQLGALTLSVLRGERGRQRKELDKLVLRLQKDIRPEIVNLPNALFAGLARPLKQRLGVPVICTMTGEDLFLDALPDAPRREAWQMLREQARHVDAFIATSRYFGGFMSEALGLDPALVHVVHPGINLEGYPEGPASERSAPDRPVIGYLARLCPEKGMHQLVEAFRALRRQPGGPPCRLRVSGYLGEGNRAYVEGLRTRLEEAGLGRDFDLLPSVDRRQKIEFLQGLDVFSVPTSYREAKGIFILEALACGVPVVQPAHGSFPELIEATGGGLLVPPNDPLALASSLQRLLEDSLLRHELGERGRQAVRECFNAGRMAEKTLAVYRRYLSPSES